MFHWFLALTLFINLFSWSPALPAGDQAIEFKDVSAKVQFGKQITFQATIQASSPVQQVYIFVEPQGSAPAFTPLTVDSQGGVVYSLDVTQKALRAFAQIKYSFRVRLASGTDVNSPTYSIEYSDTRYAWDTLSSQSFQVFWYGRDLSFGQNVLNTAEEGLKSGQRLLNIPLAQPVRIYVYSSAPDLQGALVGGQTWVAGHAAPDLGVVLVSIPDGPDSRLEMERQLPHELMHILQYQVIGEKFTQQPLWLLEGMASVAELYPNPEYDRALQGAVSAQKLIPFENLCSGFPQDASSAFLSYAQSASFVGFLYHTYGENGLNTLMNNYQQGMSCTAGINSAFGATLTQLEYRWQQQELRVNPASLVFHNLLPFIILFAVLFGMAALGMAAIGRKNAPQTAEKPL